MKIFIEKSKTDIYREGAWVYISRSHNMCPVKHLEDYLRLVNTNTSAPVNMFSEPSLKAKSHDYAGKTNLSHTLRQNLLKVIKAVGLNWKDYGLHILRAGGASLDYRLFKRYGRWKCDRAKDGYVEDDLKMLLCFEKSLKLSPFIPTLNHPR